MLWDYQWTNQYQSITNKFHNFYDMANSDIDIIMITKMKINDIFPESVLYWRQI